MSRSPIIDEPRETGLRVRCPRKACHSPSVCKVRRIDRTVWIQCKVCKHRWKEIHDDGVVHGLIIIAPPTLR